MSVVRLRDWGDAIELLGPLLFVVLGIALSTFFVPFPIIAVGAGVAFGIAAGTAVAITIAPLAACAQLLIARYVVRDSTNRLLNGHARAVGAVLEQRGFAAALYTHLKPGLPYGPMSCASGLTRLRATDVAAGMALANAPRAFAFAALGSTLAALDTPKARVAMGLLILLAIGGLIGIRFQIRGRRAEMPRIGPQSTPEGM